MTLAISTTFHVPAGKDHFITNWHPSIPAQVIRHDDEGPLESRSIDVTDLEHAMFLALIYFRWNRLGFQRSITVRISQLFLYVDDVIGGIPSPVSFQERYQRGRHIQRLSWLLTRRRPLLVGVGTWITFVRCDMKRARLVVDFLPNPEDTINIAVVQEEDRVKGCDILLAHVPIGSTQKANMGIIC